MTRTVLHAFLTHSRRSSFPGGAWLLYILEQRCLIETSPCEVMMILKRLNISPLRGEKRLPCASSGEQGTFSDFCGVSAGPLASAGPWSRRTASCLPDARPGLSSQLNTGMRLRGFSTGPGAGRSPQTRAQAGGA